jgi:hypothetical protein
MEVDTLLILLTDTPKAKHSLLYLRYSLDFGSKLSGICPLWLGTFIGSLFILYIINVRVINRDYMLDATRIFNTMPTERKISLVKLGFYLISFFIYLYR